MLLQRSWFQFVFGEISTFLIMCLTFENMVRCCQTNSIPLQVSKKQTLRVFVGILITALVMNVNGLLPGYDPQRTLSKIVAVVDTLLTLIFPLFVTWATYIHLWQHSKKSYNYLAIEQCNEAEACAHVSDYRNVYNSVLDSDRN